MKQKKLDFITIVDDRLWKSVVKDTYTIAAIVFAIGVGVAVGSVVMQWVAALLFILSGLAKMVSLASVQKMTISEAREYLDSLD